MSIIAHQPLLFRGRGPSVALRGAAQLDPLPSD